MKSLGTWGGRIDGEVCPSILRGSLINPRRGCRELSTRRWFEATRITEERLLRNVHRFRGGLVFKAHRLCVPLNSRLESNKEEKYDHGTTSESVFAAQVRHSDSQGEIMC